MLLPKFNRIEPMLFFLIFPCLLSCWTNGNMNHIKPLVFNATNVDPFCYVFQITSSINGDLCTDKRDVDPPGRVDPQPELSKLLTRPKAKKSTITSSTTVTRTKRKRPVKLKPPKKTESEDNDDHAACHFCGKRYNTAEDEKRQEDWIQCSSCRVWVHESCGEENGVIGDEEYICKNCL